jgi:protein unc-45
LDCLSTFLSACADYITPDKEVDYRMESLEERRVRTAKQRIIRRREYNHAIWTLESDALSALVPCLNSKVSSVRVRALPCFGRLVTNACDDKNPDFIDPKVKEGESAPEGDLLIKSYLRDYLFHPVEATDFHAQKIDEIRTYACVASALLACSPDIGIWSLQVANGIRQVMFLISTGDARCQEIASEVICLASASADGGEMLRPLLESGMVTNLIKSSHAGTRAAAAAALTKLSIKAKALEENSPEIAQVLNAAFDVLRVEVKKLEKGAKGTEKSSGGDSSGVVVSSESIASVERSIEVIAAMAGKSYIKEEIVHGSSRVAKATEVLSKVSVDSRSTAAYGLAHIFAALSVTNRELRALALAEKEMTLEQYDKLQELQRIKTKDKDGNDLEEKKEEDDMDTAELCSLRIKRISASGGIGCLVRLMSAGSTKTKETSARALRQICVEQSSRGMFIQEGGLKACCAVATSKDVGSKVGDVASSDDGNGSGGGVASADARREAAHAIAKSLVTTDPRLLSAHQRLGVIQPLLVLCRDVDSTNLQQFEALMALTNILTAGDGEVGRFMKEKGHHAVHYLIFSDHHMVRRAACEVFCNIPLEEEVLKIMRKPEKVRLWLGLCEDWDNADGGEEAYLAARACAGTLASSVMDPEVADAVLVENVGASLNKLLGSEKPELIHRALVIVSQLMGGDESVVEEGLQVKMVTHFLEAGVVLSLTAAVKVCKNVPSLYTMAKDTAEKLVMLASGVDAVGMRT